MLKNEMYLINQKINFLIKTEDEVSNVLNIYSNVINYFLKNHTKSEIVEIKSIVKFLKDENKNIFKDYSFHSDILNDFMKKLISISSNDNIISVLNIVDEFLDLFYLSVSDTDDDLIDDIVSEYESTIKWWENIAKQKENEVSNLNTLLQEKENEVIILNTTLEEKESEISSLTEQLNNVGNSLDLDNLILFDNYYFTGLALSTVDVNYNANITKEYWDINLDKYVVYDRIAFFIVNDLAKLGKTLNDFVFKVQYWVSSGSTNQKDITTFITSRAREFAYPLSFLKNSNSYLVNDFYSKVYLVQFTLSDLAEFCSLDYSYLSDESNKAVIRVYSEV
jgi:hypothetical protein